MKIAEDSDLSAPVSVEDAEQGFLWRIGVLDVSNMGIFL